MSTRKRIAWSCIQVFFQRAFRLAAWIVIARLLTPDKIGTVATAMSANYLQDSVRTFEVGRYLIEEPEMIRNNVRTVFDPSWKRMTI